MLRVGIVGFGSIGSQHARVIDSHANLDLVGIADIKVSRILDKFRAKFYDSIDELIRLKPDYVVIATPTITHTEIADFFLSKRIGVLIEKPISNSFDSALTLISRAGDDCFARVGHIERFNSASIEAKRLITSGQIGKVISVSTFRHSPLPNRIQDVGVILDLATHDIDLVQWMVNSEYRECIGQTKTLTSHSSESLLYSMGELLNGCLVTHSVNWISPYKKRSLTILGEIGTLEVDLLHSEVTLLRSTIDPVKHPALTSVLGGVGSESSKLSFQIDEPLMLEHSAVFETFTQGDSALCTLAEGARVVDIASHLARGLEYKPRKLQ